MKKTIVLCFGLVFGVAALAHAQATRTWVSGTGDDVNVCSRTLPCKTFTGAILKTNTGGYINALDPGGFGTVSITKSITIDGGAGLAGISFCTMTQGILVNGEGVNVILRNLSIEGCGTGSHGIRILSAATVHVENVTIKNFTQNGVISTATAKVFMDQVTVKEGANGQGVNIQSGTCALDHVHTNAVLTGILVGATGVCTVKNSVSSGNASGFVADGAAAQITVENSLTANNENGVKALNGGVVRLSGVTLANNTTAAMYNDGVSFLASFLNNSFASNAVDGTFSYTIAVK